VLFARLPILLAAVELRYECCDFYQVTESSTLFPMIFPADWISYNNRFEGCHCARCCWIWGKLPLDWQS